MKPKVEYLRWVFGCSAYAHIPKDERGKLTMKPKDTNCMTGQQQIFHTRGVHFNEEEKTNGDATAADELAEWYWICQVSLIKNLLV